jgi:predicted transcriptional regulator
MKSLTVRLPEDIVSQLEAEAKRRKMSKSDIVRERLSHDRNVAADAAWQDTLSGVIGAVDGLPADLSSNTREHLKTRGYGR